MMREEKAINLSVNPHVILMPGCNHRDKGLDLVVRATLSAGRRRFRAQTPRRANGPPSGTDDPDS